MPVSSNSRRTGPGGQTMASARSSRAKRARARSITRSPLESRNSTSQRSTTNAPALSRMAPSSANSSAGTAAMSTSPRTATAGAFCSRASTTSNRPGELSRDPQEGPHPPPFLADQGRRSDRGVRAHRDVLQPPPTPLAARDALARRLREQHSHRPRDQSRRFAARVITQDQIDCNNGDASRLRTPCPPNRGRSKQRPTRR